jgi:CRP/FNR family cyclic AMP-dependent transcriptional regulator
VITRFEGDRARTALIAALRGQQIICDEVELAEEIRQASELVQVDAETSESEFIKQGDDDNSIYFILMGRVSIRIHGREVAVRSAGWHVGELALIDATKTRSASVVALERTVMARVTEAKFTQIAERHAVLWRRLAMDVADRLRERGALVRPKNSEPVVFIGSSAESLPVAREIQSTLSHDRLIVQVWTDGIFRASSSTIEDLLDTVDKSDFAVLVLTGDDTVISRDFEMASPRDNCIFELGLFMGVLRRERTIIVKPRGKDIKIPSDLLGFTLLEFAPGQSDTMQARLGPVANEVRRLVERLGSR